MSISATHFFGGVTNEIIDYSLINTSTGEIANEAVTKTVPTFDIGPAAILQSLRELVLHLVFRYLL